MNLLETTDWLVIALYFVIIAAIAIWSIMKRNNSAKDYFLAGKNLGWFVIGSSIFASNIGSEHLVGLAGSGATDGVAMAHYELQAWCLIVLAWVLMPFYLRSKVFTMPEFLEKRFSGRARTVLSAISLIAYILTKLAVGVYAGGMVFNALIPEMNFMGLDSFWIGSILIIVLTGIYTVLGGMKAVAYTEAFQTVILIIGASLVTILGLQAIGGWGELKATVGDEMFNLWKPIVPEGVENTWKPVKESAKMAWYFNDNYPWIGMLFCAPIIGLWYWTTDQYIVQRVLGAANETQARRGAIAAAFFKLFPVFIFIIPGIISYALAVSGKMPILGQELLDANGEIIRDQAQQAFPLMVMHILPVGVRGLVVAGLFAALMSSLAGAFNASSTLFTIDFYSKLKPNVSQKELVFMGRMATVVMIVIGLLWIPVIRGGKGLYDYLQGIQSYLAPPIAVVFFAGIFHKRLNAKGCLAALYVGFLLGIFRLAVDTPIKLIDDFSYTEGSFLWIINNMFFQYYSMVIFIISLIVMFVVSYMSEQPSYEQIKGLTFGTVSAEDKAATRRSWNKWDVITSSLVILIIIAIYVYFS
ncbi:MAG TPA: sodium:solute symporter [Candidatus Sphingobacterium stercoripullorum]|uniref:Sodium:solute symporter n=1 Tax=Candidatus Sphingobacterium stercoripullorum TaxID=2838759 RepID=A0A9D1WAM5_9SPHI|nr:sodium:solute symporter [Candidatus Sphingobacterium stercoripullorum]